MKTWLWALWIPTVVLALACSTFAGDRTDNYSYLFNVDLAGGGQSGVSLEPQPMPGGVAFPQQKGDAGADCGTCWQFYGDALLLRPGNDKVAFGVPINGAIVPPAGAAPVQIGPDAVADPGFDVGFRVGLIRTLSECSSIGVSYSWFEGDDTNSLTVVQPNVIRSLVYHPGSANAATDFLTATATNQIQFRLADVDFRRIISQGSDYSLNYLIGARYAHLDEVFQSRFTNSTTIEDVNTNIDFDGGGIRFGLEGERQNCQGWLIYGRGYASFVGGRFVGTYSQADSVRGSVVSTGWSEDRVLSILDAEAGVGWASSSGRFRVTAGYMFSGWFNAINTDDFIHAVQTNNSVSVSDTLTFDGFVLRGEIRF